MKVIIIGAGQVGRAVAKRLAQEHNVVVIDYDPERLEKVRFESDVMTYEGNGAELSVLRSVEIEQADLAIASTSDDQSNILISSTAKALSEDTFTIARVAETGYLSTWSQLQRAFNVDLMVGADDLTARGIASVAGIRTARHVEFFSDGKVEMAELQIPANSPIAGKKVQEVGNVNVNFAAVYDDDNLEVVYGGTLLRAETRLIVIGRPEDVHQFARDIHPEAKNKRIRNVIILGGGEIAYQTARLMQQQNITPKLVEHNTKRAHFLAENLAGSIVLENDATDPDFLRQEGVEDADILISALRPDDRNLLTALLGKNLGAERSISVVHNTKYESLFIASGVDVTLNPRHLVIQEILRYTRKGGIKKLAFVGHHRGEVVEIELTSESLLVGRPLQEAAKDLPREMVVGAVTRGKRVIIPRGDTVLQAGDHLIIFVDIEFLEAMDDL